MKALTQIRKIAIARANRLQRAASHLDTLRPAFAEWGAGEIYVCKKTGDYRYRFGDRSKAVASWSATARQVFATPEAFAFAAMVLADPAPQPLAALPAPAPQRIERANVIALASAAA